MKLTSSFQTVEVMGWKEVRNSIQMKWRDSKEQREKKLKNPFYNISRSQEFSHTCLSNVNCNRWK